MDFDGFVVDELMVFEQEYDVIVGVMVVDIGIGEFVLYGEDCCFGFVFIIKVFVVVVFFQFVLGVVCDEMVYWMVEEVVVVGYVFVMLQYVEDGFIYVQFVEVVVWVSDNVVFNFIVDWIGGFVVFDDVFVELGDVIMEVVNDELIFNMIEFGSIDDIMIVVVFIVLFMWILDGFMLFVVDVVLLVDWMSDNWIGDVFICFGVFVGWMVVDKLGGVGLICNDIVVVMCFGQDFIIIMVLMLWNDLYVDFDDMFVVSVVFIILYVFDCSNL